MNHRIMARQAPFLLACGLILTLVSCDSEPSSAPAPQSKETGKSGAASQPTSRPGQDSGTKTASTAKKLLELAGKTATAIPGNPHLKGQAKALEDVVLASLAVNDTEGALRCAQTIPNWRKGTALADIAFHLAKAGETERVAPLLAQASAVAEAELKQEVPQAWRRDRIRMRIARVHAFMGDETSAASLETGVEKSEAGAVEAVRAHTLPDSKVDLLLAKVDDVVRAGTFDQIRNLLSACVQLYDRLYAQPERRKLAEERVLNSYAKLPLMIRVELVLELIEVSLKHEDKKKALELVQLVQDRYLDKQKWLPADEFRFRAQLAGFRHRAGDTHRALREAQAVAVLFDTRRKEMFDIDRASALRPLAEAWVTLERHDDALKTYKRVAEEGVANPNSRPRAEDLVATCCSIARTGFEPDDELMKRLQSIHDGLGKPW